MTKINWNPDQVAMLKSMVALGKSYAHIASAIGTTRNAVSGKVFRLGISAKGSKKLIADKPVNFVAIPIEFVCEGVDGVSLSELGPSQCKYPVSPFMARTHRFCGKPTAVGYCDEHYKTSYYELKNPDAYTKSVEKYVAARD